MNDNSILSNEEELHLLDPSSGSPTNAEQDQEEDEVFPSLYSGVSSITSNSTTSPPLNLETIITDTKPKKKNRKEQRKDMMSCFATSCQKADINYCSF